MAFRVRIILQVSLYSLYFLFWWLRYVCTWVLSEENMWYFLVVVTPFFLHSCYRLEFFDFSFSFSQKIIWHFRILVDFWMKGISRAYVLLKVLSSLLSPYDPLSLPCYFSWFWHVLSCPVNIPLDCSYKSSSSHIIFNFILFSLDFPLLSTTLNKNQLDFKRT